MAHLGGFGVGRGCLYGGFQATALCMAAALDALKVRMRAQKTRRVTVPLIRAVNGSDDPRTIDVADMDALSANLPDGCSLANENGVISVTVFDRTGFVLTVR